jgi:PAS domain S-box-containing protein
MRSILSVFTGIGKQNSNELEKQRVKYQAIVSLMGEGLFVVDQEGRITTINLAAQQMLEVGESEAIGKYWTEVAEVYVGNKRLETHERTFYQTLHKGQSITTTLADNHYYKTHTGKMFPVLSVTTPLKGIGAVKVFRDATHEREIDRMKTEFIALASHQLRTPLSAIKWFTEMLVAGDAGKLNPEQAQFAANIEESTQRMIDLVNSLLNISRIESGRIIIDPQPTNLVELVDRIVAEIRPKLEEKKQHVVVSIHENLPLLSLDPKLVRQVYINLLTNASKYSPPQAEIVLSISKKDADIISQVADNGYGIPKEERSKVFTKFFRAENVVRFETDGSGLGLYLAKLIVEASGGRIWFESSTENEGNRQGSTFWFTLPINGFVAKKGEVSLD